LGWLLVANAKGKKRTLVIPAKLKLHKNDRYHIGGKPLHGNDLNSFPSFIHLHCQIHILWTRSITSDNEMQVYHRFPVQSLHEHNTFTDYPLKINKTNQIEVQYLFVPYWMELPNNLKAYIYLGFRKYAWLVPSRQKIKKK
jgi:hypothetical protein